MAAAESRRACIGAGLFLVLALASCAPRSQPKVLPPQAVTKTTPDPPPPSEPPVAVPVPPRNETIVIEPGAAGTGDTTSEALVAAARAERERRRNAPEPAIVLDNQSLAKYSSGQLTVATVPSGQESTAAGQLAAQAEREQYWRDRVRASRQRWHDAAEAITAHQSEAEELRTKFYAEDDPYVRDGQIKPAWDRALDLLAQAKRDAAEAEVAVADTLEEGRRAGAWPGWLREGAELEPEAAPKAAANGTLEPGEPVVVEEPPRNPPQP